MSIAAHITIMAGLVVSGVWRIEQLDRGRTRPVALSTPLPPPPASSGGPVAAPTEPLTPKRPPIAKGLHQPKKPPEADRPDTGISETPGPGTGTEGTTPDSPCLENCGEGLPADPVCGNGALETGEQCDDGNTLGGDGCSSTCRIEARPAPVTPTIAPPVLQGLRISGETQIHPSAVTVNQMMRDGASRAEGIVKLCITTDGSVSSARVLATTKYPAYDESLLAGVRDWRYRPYLVNGTAVPACSTVRFVYTIQ